MTIDDLFDLGPVIPVVAIDDVASAVPIANALLAGGIGAIEVTLRTPAALGSITRICERCPRIVVGAGTLVDAAQFKLVADAGARFAVSPGATPSLLAAQAASALAWLPAASSVSESMQLRDAGLARQKFFPAGASGGPAYLAAVRDVLPDVRYCPTGGISSGNAEDYLRLANVAAVGGSWVTPRDAIARSDFAAVEALAREAQALPRG